MKKALIIGTGAVGCAIAISCASQGMYTAVLARRQTADYIRENGLKRTGIFGDIEIAPENLTVYEEYSEISIAYDYVIVAAKTMANEEVAATLSENKNILADDGKIIIFQNGWGNEEAYLKYFSKQQIYHARIITGFARTAPGTTKVTVHTAPILLGSLYGMDNSCMEDLAKAINDSGIPSEVSSEIEKALWAKMLFNTTLNPLGAILNMTYGELSESESLCKIMNGLIEETFAVMEACGYHTFWANAAEYKEAFYGKLVPDTYRHRSSTLQDIEKKQKTEINTLNGCVVRLASRANVAVPYHTMIVNMIRGIEDHM